MDIEGIINENEKNVFFFSKSGCTYCDALENALITLNIPYTKIPMIFPEEIAELKRTTKYGTFPQLFFGKDDFVVGFAEFNILSFTTKLQERLNKLGISIIYDF